MVEDSMFMTDVNPDEISMDLTKIFGDEDQSSRKLSFLD
jgi:hypothetical protein